MDRVQGLNFFSDTSQNNKEDKTTRRNESKVHKNQQQIVELRNQITEILSMPIGNDVACCGQTSLLIGTLSSCGGKRNNSGKIYMYYMLLYNYL